MRWRCLHDHRSHHTPLRPWQAWPDSPIGPLHETFAHPDLQQTFAVGQCPGNRFVLLVGHVSSVSFAPAVDPSGASVGSTTAVEGSSPLFVRHGWGGHLLGTLTESGELLATVVEFMLESEEVWLPTSTTVLGCADMAPGAARRSTKKTGSWRCRTVNVPKIRDVSRITTVPAMDAPRIAHRWGSISPMGLRGRPTGSRDTRSARSLPRHRRSRSSVRRRPSAPSLRALPSCSESCRARSRHPRKPA